MNRFLASVTSVTEADIALTGGADIIDLKNPAQGALGALPARTLRDIVAAVAGTKPVSATVGDLIPGQDDIAAAVAATADCGVDIVKIGFFGRHGAQHELITTLTPLARQHPLVAVLFADNTPALSLIEPLAAAGFYGVMIDTAGKQAGSLPDCMALSQLQQFVQQAAQNCLLSGLAGKLTLAHIEQLAPLGADYLGFRSALCREGDRTAGLDRDRIGQVRQQLDRCTRADAA